VAIAWLIIPTFKTNRYLQEVFTMCEFDVNVQGVALPVHSFSLFLYFCIIGLREELIALGMRAFILV
jgi:hypothetical protein